MYLGILWNGRCVSRTMKLEEMSATISTQLSLVGPRAVREGRQLSR